MMLFFIDGVKMKKKKKLILETEKYDFSDYSEYLLNEYREYRLQALAEKIKIQNIKPKIKLYGY